MKNKEKEAVMANCLKNNTFLQNLDFPYVMYLSIIRSFARKTVKTLF